MGGLGGRTKVENPNDLRVEKLGQLGSVAGKSRSLTATIESNMNPAAAASFAPSGEYTRVLTDDVVRTRPAARKPTT